MAMSMKQYDGAVKYSNDTVIIHTRPKAEFWTPSFDAQLLYCTPKAQPVDLVSYCPTY
jgi:hypothetical protein